MVILYQAITSVSPSLAGQAVKPETQHRRLSHHNLGMEIVGFKALVDTHEFCACIISFIRCDQTLGATWARGPERCEMGKQSGKWAFK